ncbi:CA2+ ACTIVATED OUTWARD RECTIFYING K+ CHANNEL 1, TWO PORE K CHANNEL, TWO PORE K CHANNEL 1 [Hibiscus trionum]|uniref:CA2+ ACTIVATED OUTWARD RECTIFYING K+ CHANNEL 1, TWO PORE K CHANNEL, TWO PORE K CHANNEL 1 n=1 Tax=Hibiscus trionum TaxID=183268 RepID=A0A9W7JJE9_HIBTR|nr:CA2+ ACTIVATED OUTWARD RECTIFYING K+ CHANNEL 1, TWO PORE K CHANNEL, TWO PORE K CHANNEL 1 [Hibiscus trionum]
MADNDARQSLLSSTNDSLNLNETKAIHRRIRPHRRSKGPSERQSEEHEKDHPFINLEPVLVPREFRFKYVLMLLGAYLGIGTFWFFLIEDQIDGKKTNGIIDAIYFCVVTMTTVGYGDLVPHSSLAKMLACLYAFLGAALVGLILSNAADYLAEKQGNLLVKALHMNEKFNSTEVLMDIETNKVKYKFLTTATLLVVLIIAGIGFLFLVEGMEFVDAFYCVCATITTLGFGDKSFSTQEGRVFAILWILSSTVCLAQFFLYLAEIYTERRQRALVKWVLTRNLTTGDLEAADMDHDEVVSAAEFILYKLKEMGKIGQEDVLMLMDRFKDLDVDHSGTLTTEDVILS